VLQFLEKFLTHKTGKPIEETNISRWRRTVTGDLTSTFQPAAGKELAGPTFTPRDAFFEQIDRSKSRPLPSGYTALTPDAVEEIRRDPSNAKALPRQEPGVRRSSALPYELFVNGTLSADRSRFTIEFQVGKDRFGDRSAGSPFSVYADTGAGGQGIRNYALAAGEQLEDSWDLKQFAGGKYHLRAYGPNGFHREFMGTGDDPLLDLRLRYTKAGDVELQATNRDPHRALAVLIKDKSYKAVDVKRSIAAGASETFTLEMAHSFRWYDFAVGVESVDRFEQRFAGRVENGQWSFTDPAMGRVV
jgi:phospholipase C